MRYLAFPIALLLHIFTCGPGVTSPPNDRPGTARVAYASAVAAPAASTRFPYGVASGDPLPDGIVLWSMLDPRGEELEAPVSGAWEIATDPALRHVVRTGRYLTGPERRYAIKIDVRDLAPETYYYYRFRWGEHVSPVGRTKTAPDSLASVPIRLAVVSCNAYEWGYFNAFASLAERDDLDAVVHLGDYIYEYAVGEYGDTTLGRFHEPRHEAITAADYHARYAQYRRDPDLQRLHAQHPFISIWDDHEVANNNYTLGAENHQESTEGDYRLRVTAARRIYYDWMPVRETANGRLYRSFRFGRNVDLLLLDERLAGRTAPADSFAPADLADSTRTMLGAEQFDWLTESLARSDAAWRLIGNQVLFADLDLSRILPEYAVNVDAWDGYRAEKDRLTTFLRTARIEDLIFLTGDTHCSWYFEVPGSLAEYRQDPTGSVLAYELGTPSISSANYDELIGGWDTLLLAKQLLYRYNPHLRYVDLKEHGYLLLEVDHQAAKAGFYFQRDIRRPGADEYLAKEFHLPHSAHS